MALSGLHVTCGSVGVKAGTALFAAASWSQTMTSAATTSQGAREPGPGRPTQNYDALMLGFEVTGSVDAYVAVGSAPDPTQTTGTTGSTARIFVPAGVTRNIFCNANDLLAWTPA